MERFFFIFFWRCKCFVLLFFWCGFFFFFPELYWVLPKLTGKMKCFQQEASNHFLLCFENGSLCAFPRVKSSAPFSWTIRTTARNLSEKLIFWGYYEILSKINAFYWSKIYFWSSVALKEPPPNFRYQCKLILMHQYPISSEPRIISALTTNTNIVK